jgi:hypothetical protein
MRLGSSGRIGNFSAMWRWRTENAYMRSPRNLASSYTDLTIEQTDAMGQIHGMTSLLQRSNSHYA